MRKKICVIDGQGGGIGAAVIKRLKEVYGETVEILAVGANAVAASQMMKAKANRGASGENAVVRTAASSDIIVGPISITWANAMMGEITPSMAEAVTSAKAMKFLIPLFQEDVAVVGLSGEPLPHLVEEIVTQKIKEHLENV